MGCGTKREIQHGRNVSVMNVRSSVKMSDLACLGSAQAILRKWSAQAILRKWSVEEAEGEDSAWLENVLSSKTSDSSCQ
jgi:hypothetical protein